MQDQSYRSVHPAIARLHAELDAARRGVAVLDDLGDERRERVVAELLSAVPDAACRAANEVGTDGVVETIRRYAHLGAATDERTRALWDRIVRTAVEAAVAAGSADPGTSPCGSASLVGTPSTADAPLVATDA